MGQLAGSACAALEDLAETDILGERHTFFKGAERPAVEQVRRIHGVSRLSQGVREGEESRGLPERVVKQQDLGH